MGLFDALEQVTNDDKKIIRAPFGYLGSKRRSLKYILPALPYRKVFVDVFGGSGVVILNRQPSVLDVYNDRFGGIVAFYRCLRDDLDALCARLELMVNAKEEFYWCRETWKDCTGVERAARWYYMQAYSFARKSERWGRTVSSRPLNSGVYNKIKDLQVLHDRFKNIQIENASWEKILDDYDSPDTVFYLDPPYVKSSENYGSTLTVDDHRRLLEAIHNLDGFAAISGYSNSLYEGYEWDDRISWEVTSTVIGNAGEGNNKHSTGQHSLVEEILWIKE